MADNHHEAIRTGSPSRIQHVFNHRPTTDRMQHFRNVGFHPSAFAGGKDHSKNLRHDSGFHSEYQTVQ
jgi:hypothetical protein